MSIATNPGAALRHLIDAAKELDPALTDKAVADALGVSPPALANWCDNKKPPTARNRLAIAHWLSGLVSALPAAWAAKEKAEVESNVPPFGTKAAS